MRREHGFAAALLVACCGGGNKTPDAPNSGPLNFQGEYVDWDSTNASFCGILGATYTVSGSATSVSTPPNGRLMASMPVGVVEIDITPPSTASQCVSGSANQVYDNPGLIAIDPVLVGSGVQYSTRSFTTVRRTSMFAALGITYDPTKAQVVVNVLGTATAPQVAATHAVPAAFNGSAWGSGDTGVYVFFPNVDASVNHTTLTATNYAQTLELPVQAGTFSYAAVSN
jgi:hypothetical protein